MRKMKDSGIEWIGKIPEGWEVEKLGKYFTERVVKVSDTEFEPLSVTKKGIVKQLENVAKTKNNDDRKLVCRGDFVINSRSDRKQSCGLSQYDGSVSVINIALTPRDLQGNYVKYLLNNYGFAEEFFRWGSGIHFDLWSTKFSKMKKISIPLANEIEQHSISVYLDNKVALIDSIIEKVKVSIEEYKNYKRSIITETVTKGLELNVKMRDSEIEWVGEVPEHWENVRLKYVLQSIGKKNLYKHNYIGLENVEKETGRYVDIAEKTTLGGDTLSYEKGSILFGKLRPYLAKVYATTTEGCCSSEFLVLNNISGDRDFCFYRILSGSFVEKVNSSTYGAKMPRANWDFIKELIIPMPPLDEQKEIALFLKEKTKKIDDFISGKELLISELESYKKSLIYEVVTGKKEIN